MKAFDRWYADLLLLERAVLLACALLLLFALSGCVTLAGDKHSWPTYNQPELPDCIKPIGDSHFAIKNECINETDRLEAAIWIVHAKANLEKYKDLVDTINSR